MQIFNIESNAYRAKVFEKQPNTIIVINAADNKGISPLKSFHITDNVEVMTPA